MSQTEQYWWPSTCAINNSSSDTDGGAMNSAAMCMPHNLTTYIVTKKLLLRNKLSPSILEHQEKKQLKPSHNDRDGVKKSEKDTFRRIIPWMHRHYIHLI